MTACSPTEPPAHAALVGRTAEPALRLGVGADPAGVSAASAWIREFAASLDFPADDVYRLDLCLSEIVANVVEHSSAGRRVGRVDLEASASADASSISVTVADDGEPFDPLSAPAPAGFGDPAQIQIGGLGIHLVRAYADACRYERAARHNRFTFNVTRGGQGAGDDA